MKVPQAILIVGIMLFAAPLFAQKTAGEGIDDSAIQSELKRKLLADKGTGGLAINLEVRKGVAQMGGFVDDAAEATKAGELAAGVKGVVKVDNQLHPKEPNRSGGQMLDDKVITSKVNTQISEKDLGSGWGVNVDTYNAVVLLTGFVDTEEKKSMVGDIAQKVSGVKKVINGVYVLK